MTISRENLQTKPVVARRYIGLGLLVSLSLTQLGALPEAKAESLFRASTTYQSAAPSPHRSLFTPPIARKVGDMVTVTIEESAQSEDKAELNIQRENVLNNSGDSPYNQVMRFFLGKNSLTRKLIDPLTAPNLTNGTRANELINQAQVKRNSLFKDNVSCQVVQVLPNGDLVVQGQKTIELNKERQDMVLTGIINPYYLDRNNRISSQQVGNLQLIRGGRGVVSRQQNDGIANKIYQYLN